VPLTTLKCNAIETPPWLTLFLHIHLSLSTYMTDWQDPAVILSEYCSSFSHAKVLWRDLPLCFSWICQNRTYLVWRIHVSTSRYSRSQFFHLHPVLSMTQLGDHHEPRFRVRHPRQETAVSLVIFGMSLLRHAEELNSLLRVDTASFTWAPGGFL
jgi:hypothetical protein